MNLLPTLPAVSHPVNRPGPGAPVRRPARLKPRSLVRRALPVALVAVLATACGPFGAKEAGPAPKALDAAGVDAALSALPATATFQLRTAESDGTAVEGGGYVNNGDSYVRVVYPDRPSLSEVNGSVLGDRTFVRFDRQLADDDFGGLEGRTWYTADVTDAAGSLPQIGQGLVPPTPARLLALYDFTGPMPAVVLAATPTIDGTKASYQASTTAPDGSATQLTLVLDGGGNVVILDATAADGRTFHYEADPSRAERIIAPVKPESMGTTLAKRIPDLAKQALASLAAAPNLDQATLDEIVTRSGGGYAKLIPAQGRQVTVAVAGDPAFAQCLTVPAPTGNVAEPQLSPGPCPG